MTEKSHPAKELLLRAGRKLPSLWKLAEEVRLERGESLPPEIYLGDQLGAFALVEAIERDEGPAAIQELYRMPPLQLAQLCGPYTTLACWRMTQGIYRIDPTVYETLIDTPLSDDIPVEILRRLPEWCIYIETPGLQVQRRDGGVSALLGTFVRLDYEQSGQWHLNLTLNINGALHLESQAFPLNGNLRESIEAAQREWGQSSPAAIEAVRAYTAPIINLLLYICAVGDIEGRHGAPGNPQPKKTKKGTRLFAVDGARTWDVGVRMGAALRRAYHQEETSGNSEHAGPRGHIRRAHWHGFRSGPRKREDGTDIPAQQRRFDLRWMPPIPVNLGDIENLPATIRTV